MVIVRMLGSHEQSGAEGECCMNAYAPLYAYWIFRKDVIRIEIRDGGHVRRRRDEVLIRIITDHIVGEWLTVQQETKNDLVTGSEEGLVRVWSR